MTIPAEWLHDPFFQQAVHEKIISDGITHLPVKYFDVSSLIAFFLVDYDKAQNLIPTKKVKAIRIKGNKALFGLALYDYRSLSDGEPYFEVGSTIMVYPSNQPEPKHPLLDITLPPDRRNTGFWVVDLPVTSKLACDAGKELWGYPKFITPIEFEINATNVMGNVKHPDNPNQAILTLQGKIGTGILAPWADLVLYSELEGNLIRATVDTRTLHGAKIASKGDIVLSVDSSANNHPMSQRLIELGLDNAHPLSVTYTQSLQLRLNEGVIFE